MKIPEFLEITLIAGSLFCGVAACGEVHPNVKHVDVVEFIRTAEDPDVVVVDVRTAKEHSAGAIGAEDLNIDVMAADFENRVDQLIPAGKTVAIYCRSGNRSKKAAEILARKGYRVVELNEGFKAWTNYRQDH